DIPSLPVEVPEAWAFGATPEHADGLLELVLAGVKTGTASSVRDYEASGDPLPQVGELSVILDGSGAPRAVLRTISLPTVPHDEGAEEQVGAGGAGDRARRAWRGLRERFWRTQSEGPRGWAPDMPELCERVELVVPVRWRPVCVSVLSQP